MTTPLARFSSSRASRRTWPYSAPVPDTASAPLGPGGLDVRAEGLKVPQRTDQSVRQFFPGDAVGMVVQPGDLTVAGDAPGKGTNRGHRARRRRLREKLLQAVRDQVRLRRMARRVGG